MQKPTGYDEAQASGGKLEIEPGGHYCLIKQVSETTSSTGKEMIVVLFDLCAPDKQAGCFTESFNNDTREEKKWPFAGSKYIMVKDYNDNNKTSKQFKGFCVALEKSNNYEIKWGIGNWAAQFKGKKIGAVYGDEEQEYNGETYMRTVVKWFCDIKEVKDAKIPKPKYLKKTASVTPQTASNDTGFMNIPEDVTDEEIPF